MDRKRLNGTMKKYEQKSIKKRLEAFFLENIGIVVNDEQLKQVARNPKTGKDHARWHQRISELRVDDGYTISTSRDDSTLKNTEYCLVSEEKRVTAKARRKVDAKIKAVLLKTAPICVYDGCTLKEGDIDPIGGGTVRLQVDHKTAHDHDDYDGDNIENYQLLCGRHNVTKKNLWDDQTGKINIRAVLQFISREEKQVAFDWLKSYFEPDVNSPLEHQN